MFKVFGKKVLISLSVIFLLVSGVIVVNGSNASAITFGTWGVDSACGGQCDGWYTNHFAARFHGTDGPSGHYTINKFEGTNTGKENQFGDDWTIMLLRAYSMGDQVYSDTSKAQSKTQAVNSTFWHTYANKSVRLAKGNNRVDFHFVYALKLPSGKLKETWYPIRRASNIN
ncbi:hypothetical protein [Sutcliffiella rhizosphaerae]|uniref:Uncharacterized protein n=1 Tax=Sutcliffiella rhizosphaerae TaxID=2880967 RepID=A0ABM8YTL1_9BACI|nr:hypothetical protein [Sutcliffiella rhizosphaerae]CAG9623303.1 hypothetical protein BACCIP111883_04104 [Sutcliffiella rhizosphaerae]